jgi:acetylglutamate kinase
MPVPPPSAEAFAAAVERVAAHRDRPVVVKLGGSAMEVLAATDACLRSVATLHRLGVPIVLVHGGGKPIDRAMAQAGLTPKKVAGRRYTDDATLAIVVRVLHEINAALVAKLRGFGADAFGTSERMLAERLQLPGPDGKPIDLGHVGRVTCVDDEFLRDKFKDVEGNLGRGTLPVLPSLALDRDDDTKYLNVNADTAASAVAGALAADKAIFLTDTPGVLRDRANPDSLIPKLTEREARELIAAGVIDGGMVPKVEACFEALAAGAKSALILDGRVPFSLLAVFLADQFKGTAISR